MHLIQQHIFDIQCSSQGFGKEIQGQLPMLLEKGFYPQLEALFNTYDVKNHVWNIDTLDIEIPTISKKYWKTEVVQKTLAAVEAYLKKNHSSFQEKKDSLINSSPFISKSDQASYLFFNFLKTGKVIENTVSKDLEKIVSKIDVQETFVKELIMNFQSNKNALMRWIFSVPAFFKELVIRKFNMFPNEFLNLFDTILNRNEKQDEAVKNFLKRLNKTHLLKEQWIELIQWVYYFEIKGISKEIIFKEFVQRSNEFWEITAQEIHSLCQYILENHSSVLSTNEVNSFFQSLKRSISFDSNRNNKINASTIQVGDIEQNLNLTSHEKNKIDVEKTHYINNAGLVILHPFLKALFEQLDLCEKDGTWKKKRNQHKAILLTQYLVNGTQKIQESDLILNKLFCGFSIEEVVNVKLKITKKEKEKCNNLLEAVKEHWKVMNRSSIEALQETFLQREGKLELLRENEYELRIEEKGVDILLEQLPWGLGMIQTPWMEHYLHCHWN